MWNTLIVDDEPPIRSELAYLLEQDGRCRPIREAGSTAEAVAAVFDQLPDVIFLDISMPGTSGMKLAESLKGLRRPPAIVFITAHAEFAADAFDLEAVDYVLKPIEETRLASALNRVERALKTRASSHKQAPVSRVIIERGGQKTFIPASDIVYIEARADNSLVVTEQETSLVSESILSFEKRLTNEGFLRVHRSYLVNLDYVHDVIKGSNGLYTLVLEGDGTSIPVSRRHTAETKARLGLA